MKEPKKLGRPRGTSIEKALNETTAELDHLQNLKLIMNKMSDKKRKLFVALARGYD